MDNIPRDDAFFLDPEEAIPPVQTDGAHFVALDPSLI
jgi:hypothetical protein